MDNIITVAGITGSGKSLIAYHIKKMLKEKFNIDAQYSHELEYEPDLSRFDKYPDVVNLKGNWKIKEVQLPRESLNA